MKLLTKAQRSSSFFKQKSFVSAESMGSTESSSDNDAPSVAGSDVSTIASDYDTTDEFLVCKQAEPRVPLQWEFRGLTLWLEFEEYDDDLTRAIEHAVRVYGIERIPVPHVTALYGMTHLSPEQAMEKLQQLPTILQGSNWPDMASPKGVRQDVAQEGRPGQVCSIAWAELTLTTNEEHEGAMEALYELFEVPTSRQAPWSPHVSLAYDNPQDSVLNLEDTVNYVESHPSLMRPRRFKALSLWNTAGRMAQWQCLDRVYFCHGDDDGETSSEDSSA